MTTRDYPRQDIETFGRELLDSGDLDPIYVALSKMEWDEAQRDRWLIAYWLCYHAGAASWMGEHAGPWFWKVLLRAAHNEEATPLGGRWPRAPERRHWRGKAAVACVSALSDRYPMSPERMVAYVAGSGGGPVRCRDVRARVEEHVAFGPWISFKICDMLERCCGVPVLYEPGDVMYDSPIAAAVRCYLTRQGFEPGARVKDERAVTAGVLDWLGKALSDQLAPPLRDRPLGLPELETILCKWGSHMNGHYPPHNDLIEIRAGSEPWASVSATAAEFLHHFPTVPCPSSTAKPSVAVPEALASARA